MRYIVHDTDLILDSPSSDKRGYSERKYDLKIKDLLDKDKPREKLLRCGASALTSSELMAVILGTGTKKEGVLEMSSRILKEYGEKILSHQAHPLRLAKDLDLPLSKTLQIAACAELGKRFFEKNPMSMRVLRTAKDAYSYVRDMRVLSKEHMRGIYLDTHFRVIHDEVISIGTVNSSIIHPREVFKPALEYGAVAVILAHNHPSGIVEPSQADIEVTKQLVAAGKIIGIHLVDHIIIGPDVFKSIPVEY
jgi:DNA repair protein RadC